MSSTFDVVDHNGMHGTVNSARWPAGPTDELKVQWDDGRETMIPAASLIRQSDGTYSLADAEAEPSVVVPVIEEQLDVGKRVVETGGGVRVHKVVHQHEELIDQPLLMQEVDVKRVPIGKVVDGPVAIRHAGDTMIVPVLEERLVIQKQLILKEEIHITKRELSSREPQRVIVREEEAQIERLTPDGQAIEDAAAPPDAPADSRVPFGSAQEKAPSIFESFHDPSKQVKRKTEQRRISWTHKQPEPDRKQ